MQQLSKSDRRMFSASDDRVIMQQIQATHAPDDRIVEVKPILQIVEDIFRRARPSTDGVHDTKGHKIMAEDKILTDGFDVILQALAYLIQKISCELACKCSGGGDAHATTMVLFNSLSSYSWDAKVVITLAAFAVNCGEFWLVAQLWTTNSLAKSVALLKQLPDILENSSTLKPQFDELNKLINAIMDVTKCIIEFTELPSQYISHDTPAMATAMAYIPTAAYWAIRSIVACAAQIASLIGLRHEYTASTMEVWELSSLAHKVSNIHGHLRKQLALCHQHIDEKRHMEHYHNLLRLLGPEASHVDNWKVFKALLWPREDLQPLINCPTKITASIDVLKRKHVLLLISDLNIPLEEVSILSHMYTESMARPELQYEVVWLPVWDRSNPSQEANQEKFMNLQSNMPWYTVLDPLIIEPAVLKYIKEVWRFANKSIVVSLDPHGRVVSPNALHMMFIWGNLAFPFSVEKEEALWKSETWGMSLLADEIDPEIQNSIAGGKVVCLYGGTETQWIKTFATVALAVAKDAGVAFELFYAGQSNAKEKVRKNNEVVRKEGLSRYWPSMSVWYFWKRLESMLCSKLQLGKSAQNDNIAHEVTTMLSFNGSDVGWALVYGAPGEIARANGDIALTAMQKFEEWKEDAKHIGFVPALINYLQKNPAAHHCSRLILPGIDGGIQETVVCAECGRPMEKFLMYRCCVED